MNTTGNGNSSPGSGSTGSAVGWPAGDSATSRQVTTSGLGCPSSATRPGRSTPAAGGSTVKFAIGAIAGGVLGVAAPPYRSTGVCVDDSVSSASPRELSGNDGRSTGKSGWSDGLVAAGGFR